MIIQDHQARRQRCDGLQRSRKEKLKCQESTVSQEEKVRKFFGEDKADGPLPSHTHILYASAHTAPYGSPDAQVSSCKPTTLYFIVSIEVMVEMYRESQGIFRIYMKTRQQALLCFACRGMDVSGDSYRHSQRWLRVLQNRDSAQRPIDQHFFLLSALWILQAVACPIFGAGIT